MYSLKEGCDDITIPIVPTLYMKSRGLQLVEVFFRPVRRGSIVIKVYSLNDRVKIRCYSSEGSKDIPLFIGFCDGGNGLHVGEELIAFFHMGIPLINTHTTFTNKPAAPPVASEEVPSDQTQSTTSPPDLDEKLLQAIRKVQRM